MKNKNNTDRVLPLFDSVDADRLEKIGDRQAARRAASSNYWRAVDDGDLTLAEHYRKLTARLSKDC